MNNSSQNRTSFEQDVNWMQPAKVARPSRFQFPLRVLLIACFVSGLLLATTLTVQAGTESGTTASDRPNWQTKNTIQNMFENYVEWVEYTDAIEDELAGASLTLAPDLYGELFSVTAELLKHFENSAYPTSECARNFYYVYTRGLGYYMHIYGAWYYNTTSLTGEPIDTKHIAQEYTTFSEFYFTGEGLSAECWSKLDT